jgi:hypothetical protein
MMRVSPWRAVAVVSGAVLFGCGGTKAGAGGDTGAAGGDPQMDGAGGAFTTAEIAVDATKNAVRMDACGVTPAVIPDVAAGTYTIALTASTLSKGGVSGPTPPSPSFDNYVIVHAPLAAGDPNEDRRFFMLNGIGATASVTLPAMGTIDVMFVDSDLADNSGTATVTLSPGGASTTVDAVKNVLAYDTICHSTPAMLVVPDGKYRATLVDSTFSSGAGAHDDFVLLRIPSEQPHEDFRYVILNGVGTNHDFSPFNSETVLAWYIGASAGSGLASVMVSKQ